MKNLCIIFTAHFLALKKWESKVFLFATFAIDKDDSWWSIIYLSKGIQTGTICFTVGLNSTLNTLSRVLVTKYINGRLFLSPVIIWYNKGRISFKKFSSYTQFLFGLLLSENAWITAEANTIAIFVFSGCVWITNETYWVGIQLVN